MKTKYTVVLVFTFFLVCFRNADETYQRHIQLCSAVNTVDRKWQLVLNTNGTFAYTIKTIDTRATPKNSEQIYWGGWALVNDTLDLKIDSSDSKIIKWHQQEFLSSVVST